MGNRISVGNLRVHNGPQHEDSEIGINLDGERTAAGLGFWMGKIGDPGPLPASSCWWDELIDWTEDASEILHLFLLRRAFSAKKLSLEDGEVMQFTPMILQGATDHREKDLPKKWIGRASFFSKNVIVTLASFGHVAILPVGRFVALYTLLNRYSDLLLLSEIQNENIKPDDNSCPICMIEDQEMVTLSCAHELCTTCSKRWVCKNLECPFCRHIFTRKNVANDQWQMLDWPISQVQSDIEEIETQLDEMVTKMESQPSSSDDLTKYTFMKRTIKNVREDIDGLIVVDK